jgi:hypothetical protein
MQSSFEYIQQASSKYYVVWVMHVYDIEGDVFGSRIFLGAE